MQNIGNLKTLNEIMDGITRWEDLYNSINQLDLTDAIEHCTKQQQKTCSLKYTWTVSQDAHMLGYKTSFRKSERLKSYTTCS